MTNDIEILNRLAEIRKDVLKVNQAIGKLTSMALANNSKQLVEDVICPPDFPMGVCDNCKYPKGKCICGR